MSQLKIPVLDVTHILVCIIRLMLAAERKIYRHWEMSAAAEKIEQIKNKK